jgi:hypothetical protein
MGGGKGGGGGEAARARQEEQARQQRIREGTQRINSIFDGSYAGDGQLGAGAAYDPSQQYYLADGSLWSPTPSGRAIAGAMMMDAVRGGGDDDGFVSRASASIRNSPSGAKSAQKTPAEQFAEMLAAGKLYSGRKSTGGFNDAYFEGRKQAFLDYANPQLEDQYAKAQRELTFSLARGGLLDSSARAQKAGELQQLYDLNKQQIADQALSHSTEARNAVEDARANLISMLNATGDAEGAASAALTRASALSQPAAFSPLAQLFGDFTAGLGTQAALERANYYSGGQTPPRYSTGLFAPNSNAVQVK